VEDTGVGIPQDKFEDIFKPFEQLVDSQEGGTGLGLKITKQLVELHGGMIWVESEVDKGSRFIFTINQEKGRQEQKARKEETAFFPSVGKRHHPSATITKSSNTPNVHFHSQVFAVPALQENTATLLRSSDNGESPSEKTTEEGNSPYRVLIVDDEAVNLQVLMHQLGSLPCVIDPLGSGEEVLGMMEKLSHYDLIIVDIMLPGISGLELCREIRKRYSLDELPILMMTAGHRENTIAVAFNTGANDYISKPFDRVELVSRVKTLVLMKRAVQEVRHKAEELKKLNDQLTQLNLSLEERIQERTLELKEINEMLGMRNQELSRLEAARRRLLADISHELRTPMTAIQGYVEAIVSGLVDDSQEQERYLNTVLSKARSLNRLIQDLIELSRLESRRSDMIFEVIPLSDLVAQIKDRFALDVDQAGLVYRFQLQFDPALLDKYQVIIDMERIIQVLTNLVFNSIKYTDVGGEIRIICELDLEKTKEDVVGELVIHVEDTGCGIAPEALPYVFDRFYKDKTQNTNHGAPRGSGIGLAIAKEIVEYHNGSISVQSVVGEGTRFTFILPLYQLERITP
jgi:signal transduction histidine kinase